MMELGKVMGNNPETYKYFIQWVIGILGVQVVYYELFQNGHLLDFLSTRKVLYILLYLIITVGLVNLHIWLW